LPYYRYLQDPPLLDSVGFLLLDTNTYFKSAIYLTSFRHFLIWIRYRSRYKR